MRQAGPIAAAGLVALETMVDRLAEDHVTAQRLAQGLHQIERSLCDPRQVETNLVKVELPAKGRSAAEWSSALEKRGVRVSPCERYALRFVTHRHITEADVDHAISAFSAEWERELR